MNLLSVHLHFLSIHLRKEGFTLLIYPSCKILVKQVQGVQDGGKLHCITSPHPVPGGFQLSCEHGPDVTAFALFCLHTYLHELAQAMAVTQILPRVEILAILQTKT